MDYQKIMLLVCGLLVAAALYLALTAPQALPAKDNAEARMLLARALAFGRGVPDYTYAYSETADGYRNTYTLAKQGNTSYAELQNPLSLKRIYFMQNDTVLCLNYSGEDPCGSVSRLTELDNYLNFFRSKFFRDDLLERNKNDMNYLIDNGYVDLSPEIVQSSSSGRDCGLLRYTLNFTNLSLDEAARFGIGSNSPRVFSWTMCVDNRTGIPFEKNFNYTFNGTLHTYQYMLISFRESATVNPPANITQGETGGILGKLYKEREQQIKLASCHTDFQGEDRERCIATIALEIKRKDLCNLSGQRRDRCLVSLIPVTKDATICPSIGDPAFRDDCYIELAGAYKDKAYCDSINDQAKKQTCLGVAEPKPPANQTNTTMPMPPVNDTVPLPPANDTVPSGNGSNSTGNAGG